MMTTLPVSPAYREAIRFALLLQVITTIVLMMVLDGGILAKTGAAAMIAFWIGASLIILRRPKTPSEMDLLYLRFGYLVALVIAALLSPYLGSFRG